MAHPPLVSLIVSTLERVATLDALLVSLQGQAMPDFEVIVVDQNGDDRLAPVIAHHAQRMRLSHVRSERGLSRGRNAGMSVASGAIFAFPDDDCRYRPQTLARVAAFFDTHPAADGITGRAQQAAGERAPARFARSAHWLTRRNVWIGGVSSVIFLRAGLCLANGPFDEMLGLGAPSPWTACEETDYLVRAVAAGARVRYDPQLVVEHAGSRGRMPPSYALRGAAYGRAFGYVLRRHDAPRWTVFTVLLRACGGAGLAAMCARADLFRYHYAVARGRWRGWREGAEGASAQRVGATSGGIGDSQ